MLVLRRLVLGLVLLALGACGTPALVYRIDEGTGALEDTRHSVYLPGKRTAGVAVVGTSK